MNKRLPLSHDEYYLLRALRSGDGNFGTILLNENTSFTCGYIMVLTIKTSFAADHTVSRGQTPHTLHVHEKEGSLCKLGMCASVHAQGPFVMEYRSH